MATPLPADVATLDDYERHAAARLDPAVWAHIQQGTTPANGPAESFPKMVP